MAGAYEFMRLADVETAQKVRDTDSVLIVQGKKVKKTAKKNIGGAGGAGGGGSAVVYFVTSNNYFRTGTDWSTGLEATISDIVSAYQNGPVKIYEMYGGSFVGVGDVVGYKMYNGAEQPIWLRPYTKNLENLA